MLEITPILCRAGKMDNYAYLLRDKETNIAAVLDPSEVGPIVKECEKQNVLPKFIINTHHHFDHVEGNVFLKEKYGAKVVVGAADLSRIEGADIGLEDGQIFEFGKSSAQIIRADGHTIGHILWYFEQDKVLFTGDVLFNLAVGGLFEGTPEQMWQSLQKIKQLPDDVSFYPGHEYTLYGLRQIAGEAAQKYTRRALERLHENLPVAPVLLKDEKEVNPYLRCQSISDFYALMCS